MGLFFPMDDEHLPPGRRKGFARYREILGRDFKQFYLTNLLALASFIPLGLGVGYAVLSSSVLVLIPVSVVGGMIAGQGLAAMYDLILRRMRDVMDDWWVSFKRSLRQNWRAALLPGALEGLFLGFLAFAGALIWWGGTLTLGTALLLCAAIVIFCMIFSIWWPQVVLFEQKTAIRLKNCALFILQNFPRVLGAAALQGGFWLLMFLLLPWSGFAVPVLGVWYILFLAVFLLYDRLNEAFKIEEQIGQKFPEQAPGYDDGGEEE